jgi:hypothetical protein
MSADRSGPSSITMRQIRVRWWNELGSGVSDVIHILINGANGGFWCGSLFKSVWVPSTHGVWWGGLGGIVDVVEP